MDDCKEQRAKAQQSASNFDENAKFKHFQEGTSSNEALSTSSVLKTKSDQLKSTITVNETDACTSPKKTKANNPSKKKYMRRQKLIAKIVKRQSCSEEEAKQILFERSEQKRKTKTLEEFLSESSNCPEVKHVFKKKFIPLSTKGAPNAFELSYNVFRKYQMNIHMEPERKVSYRGFTQFLVDSPIKYQSVGAPINSSESGDMVRFYGSFHQHYYIDERLIAVAVLDILPNCISSVYLYYDPEFSFLNLGVYSALTEIALVRKFMKFLPDLKYYYMGYYIDSCPKMKYKGQFLPSDLLCCETFRWVSLESCTAKLLAKKRPYARFCDDLSVEDNDGKVDDKTVKLLYEDTVIDLQSARLKYSLKSTTVKLIREYASLVGKTCASSLIYYLSKQ
ncbi:PREDICTED: arginyl-tRNA--protein transferase 1-like [Rhagoletis zephyria]|uniref:arginyl-tRNA--protein transferase 1-like n=1 Tax=Rhagoletis zephyria TaxID=28612 RepID=UPI0008113894|nr:PREDICTED: arginyl-tRNA--protein transferase 1-like [Rhagoletis zephyria]